MKFTLCTLVHKGKSCRQSSTGGHADHKDTYHTAAASKAAQFNLNRNENKGKKIISSLQFSKVA